MKKIISIFMTMLLCITPVFAEGQLSQVNQPERKEFDSSKMITGKITSISSSQVVINVATMKEMEKKEKPSQTDATTTDTSNTKPEKPDESEMFTLTDETKTIDISSATFENEMGGGKGQPPKMENNNNSIISEKNFGSMEKPQGQPQGQANGNPPEKPANDSNSTSTTETTTKTYSDFAVGDYVMIELTEANGTVAKSMRSASPKGNPQGQNGENGQSNQEKPDKKPDQKPDKKPDGTKTVAGFMDTIKKMLWLEEPDEVE